MKDKVKHFLACAGIAVIILTICVFMQPMYGWDAAIAAAAVIIAAGVKELIWDKWLHKGTPDYYDFFWGICGGWAAILLWKFIENFV